MKDTEAGTAAIQLSERLPHRPETVWKVLTEGPLIARWLGMEPQGFRPEEGTEFTYRTDPAGAWDGTIRCKVLDVRPGRRLVYSWKSGDPGNRGYGAMLDTVVTLSLTPVEGGTLLEISHAGFHLPKNEIAYRNMGKGWKECTGRIQDLSEEE